MEHISELFGDEIQSVGIAGHIRPDGDCVGSCMGLYLYLKKEYPHLAIDVYLDSPKDSFNYIQGMDEIKTSAQKMEQPYDLFITCDVSNLDRIGLAYEAFSEAKHTCCIDHHVSNPGFAQVNHIEAEVSSASEVLYTLLDPEKVTQEIAVAIYTGMIHDTGVFQYAATTSRTMQIAGKLMDTGFDFNKIIDESFYQKTYIQNQVLGRVLAESILLLDGKVIAGIVHKKDMEFYGVDGKDMDGVVSQLRLTRGVKVAIFIYECEPMMYKVSLRSNGKVNVSKVAVYFGGGGHVRAAGCEMQGNAFDVVNNLAEQIEIQLLEG